MSGKVSAPRCETCGHRVDYHTADTDGNGTPHCWHLKFTGDGQWPCRCGQSAEQMDLFAAPDRARLEEKESA